MHGILQRFMPVCAQKQGVCATTQLVTVITQLRNDAVESTSPQNTSRRVAKVLVAKQRSGRFVSNVRGFLGSPYRSPLSRESRVGAEIYRWTDTQSRDSVSDHMLCEFLICETGGNSPRDWHGYPLRPAVPTPTVLEGVLPRRAILVLHVQGWRIVVVMLRPLRV